MDSFVNTRLLTFPNILTIGAILFFWAACAFMYSKITGQPVDVL